MTDKPKKKPSKKAPDLVLMERDGVKANVSIKEVENYKMGNWVEVN